VLRRRAHDETDRSITISKGVTMGEPFIFINTATIHEGKLEGWVKSFAEFSEFVEENEPRLLHFATYISEEGTEATILQIHPDAESMAFHMQLVADHMTGSAEYLDFSQMRIQVYGTPNEPVLAQIRKLAGSGVPVAVASPHGGFDRLPVT
jgi:hypothetical protein